MSTDETKFKSHVDRVKATYSTADLLANPHLLKEALVCDQLDAMNRHYAFKTKSKVVAVDFKTKKRKQ